MEATIFAFGGRKTVGHPWASCCRRFETWQENPLSSQKTFGSPKTIKNPWFGTFWD